MRHRKQKITLDRSASARRALIRSLAGDLIRFGGITTTTAKARAVRPFVERLITLGKRQTLPSKRQVHATLQNASAARLVVGPLAQRFAKRSGGYTRLVKLHERLGDGAPLARVELL